MPERNVELLEKTMQYIQDHPEQHAQESWMHATECGTAACFAGWACLLAGLEQVQGTGFATRSTVRSGPLTLTKAYKTNVGEVVSIPSEAAAQLGLTEREAGILFDAGNTVDELKLMVKKLVNGEVLNWLSEEESDNA